MFKTLQQHVQPRMFAILLISLLLLTGVAGYLYVLKKPVKALGQSRQTLQLLETEVHTGVSLQNQIETFEARVQQLDTRLRGTGQRLPESQMSAFVIGQLDSIAERHAVRLISVKPGSTERIFTFRELPFNVELEGSYLNLYQWLYQVEKQLGPIVIKQYEINAVANSAQRHMRLVIAAYQFIDS